VIKTFRLHNFKAFRDTGEIPLKPITVIAGPNSAGKSSILQSLLLLKQTLEATMDLPLNLDGRFIQASALSDLTFNQPALDDSEIGYDFTLEHQLPSTAVSSYFPHVQSLRKPAFLPVESEISFVFRHGTFNGMRNKVGVHRLRLAIQLQGAAGPEIIFEHTGKAYSCSVKGAGIKSPTSDEIGRIVDALFFDFIPFGFVVASDETPKRHDIVRLEPLLQRPLYDLGEELQAHLKYLGPLRDEPRRAYLHSGSPSPEIGQRGQYAAQLLWLERNNRVDYTQSLDEQPTRTRLMQAVSHAFQSLGITQPIDVRTTKNIVYQILFGISRDDATKHVTIADVGFGISQLLPIVVMGLRSPPSSILLYEQPEIHLHPNLQANLADFLLRLALQGKRIIVETHSDHFINRLRRRIAEDPTDQLNDKVSILFVHAPSWRQPARIETLRVDPYGIIENWPPDFLPESADEAAAILQASLQKRRVH